jgi:hypothetical protein
LSDEDVSVFLKCLWQDVVKATEHSSSIIQQASCYHSIIINLEYKFEFIYSSKQIFINLLKTQSLLCIKTNCSTNVFNLS